MFSRGPFVVKESQISTLRKLSVKILTVFLLKMISPWEKFTINTGFVNQFNMIMGILWTLTAIHWSQIVKLTILAYITLPLNHWLLLELFIRTSTVSKISSLIFGTLLLSFLLKTHMSSVLIHLMSLTPEITLPTFLLTILAQLTVSCWLHYTIKYLRYRLKIPSKCGLNLWKSLMKLEKKNL